MNRQYSVVYDGDEVCIKYKAGNPDGTTVFSEWWTMMQFTREEWDHIRKQEPPRDTTRKSRS